MSIQQHTRRCHQRPKQLSNEDVHRILAICDEDPNKQNLGDIVRILANTGLRVNELRNLRWSGVDLLNRRFAFDSQKGGRKRRVSFGVKTSHILQARKDSETTSEFVFGDAHQSFFNRAFRLFRIVGGHLGVTPISFHALRNSFALRLFGSGVSVQSCTLILGYSFTRQEIITSIVPYEIQCEGAAREMALMEEF